MAEAGVADDIEVQQASNAVFFSVGDSFESFDALQAKIKVYEQTQFWRRDSRTIEAARKRLDRPCP